MKGAIFFVEILFLRFALAADFHIYFYLSPSTPSKIKSSIELFNDFKKTYNQAEITEINLNNKFEKLWYDFDDEIILIIDETHSLKLSYEIQNYALDLHIPVFYTKSSSFLPDSSDLTFSIQTPLPIIRDAYDKLIHHLGIQKLAILWVFTEENEFLFNFFDTDPHFNVYSIVISGELSQESIDKIISKDLKPSGIANIIVLADSENCKNIQRSLIHYNMIVSGYVIILGHSCLNNAIIDGSILILPKYDIYSITEEESYSNSLILLLEKLKKFNEEQTFTKSQLWSRFQEFKKSFEWNFIIINQKNNTPYSIGNISNEIIEIHEKIVYPGGSTDLPEFSTINILISGNVGILNPSGYEPSIVNGLIHEGTYFAVKKINESKEVLQNFHLKFNDQINCGASVWIPDYSKSCYLENRNEMGVAYITSYLSSISIATLNLFKEMNFSIPMVSGINSAHILSNSSIYPTFTRISTNSDYMGKTWSIYMKVMDWTSCVVIYADDAYDVSVYQIFIQSTESQGITILNKEEYRKIPFTYNTSQIEKYRQNFQEAIDQNCNIFFLFCADPLYIYVFDSLYDMGMRRGDALFLINALMGSDIFFTVYGFNIDKVQELFYGTFFLFIPEWIGTLGKKLKSEFDQIYPNSGDRIRCVNFDAVWAIAEAIQMLLNSGKNYEDYKEMNWAIKNVRFRGCSGVVMIENDTNNRRLSVYSLYNSYFDNSTNKWITTEVGHFAPYSGIFFQLTNPIVWPTGKYAPSTFKDQKCPFKINKPQFSLKSKLISLSICMSTVIFCILFLLFIIKINFSYKLEEINEPTYFSDPDYWVIAMIFIESLQFQGIGPSFKAFNELLYNTSLIISYNFETFLYFKGKDFWKFFYGTKSACILWFIVELIIRLKIENQCDKIGISWILEYAFKIEGIIGHLMSGILFQPILTMLLRIIQCDYGSTTDLSQKYFNYDCQFKCWESSHISILVITIFIVFIYTAVSLKIKPLWQENQLDLNIKENYPCMMIKIVVKISLIAIYESLQTTNEIFHCSIYLFIMFGYLIFIFSRKSFNYDRANLLEISLIACVIWNSTLSLAYMIINSGPLYIWICTQILGILAIMIGSLFVKAKLPPSMLIKKEGKSILKLFRFSLMGSNFLSHRSRSHNFDQRFVSMYISDSELNRINSVFPIDRLDTPKMIYICDDKSDDDTEKIGLS